MKISEITRLTEIQAKALGKLKLHTANDLLRYFPVRYGDTAEATTINTLSGGMNATIFGRITRSATKKAFRSKMPMAEATIEDDTGGVKAIWFNQAYISKMYPVGTLVRIQGIVTERKGIFSFSNPHIEAVAKVPDGVGESLFTEGEDIDHSLYPVYRESKGITSNWILHTIQRIFADPIFEKVIDPLPEEMLEKYNLPTLRTALVWIHTPKKREHAEAARKRFAFEEIFQIQLKRGQERKKIFDEKPFVVDVAEEVVEKFTSRFPFKLTPGQNTAISEILRDFSSGHPMSRLLEGDVGSGKTAVAATTAYAITMTRPLDLKSENFERQKFGHLQTAYMVPTEILARQHFESFIKYFSHLPINIALITGSGCKKFPSKVHPDKATDISRSQLLKWVANGEIPIIIGTHTLIQKTVRFKHLAYVIIDEQHRFGTAQRQKLARKESEAGWKMPHLLSMTATPIPRTLALTMYGNLDLTTLNEMPTGRKPVITEIILPKDRQRAYDRIREELQKGRQAYVICPRIDEPDPEKEMAVNAVSAKAEAKRLRKEIFPEYEIDVLHSKMLPKIKEEVMQKFEKGLIKILVSTSVVEVGVNVPNATVMIIEGAERFGLAQLHQLRGRVIRSNDQAYCFVCAESTSEKTVDRLKALKTAKNGFELAEHDLSLRGSGGLSGTSQWGITDIGMEALKNLKLVLAARNEAKALIDTDPELNNHPLLKHSLSLAPEVHFE